ncbi:MAG TPA: YidC/Oxa1 family membrane protein insertase [Candidatus Saccharimonadales bacterium]
MNLFDLLIVQPIFNLLIGLYSIIPGGDFGIAIIIFTIIVRFLLYPLTKSMLHQTRVMRKLQPELVRIRKQNKDNKQLAGVQMMELYKKHGVNPFRPIGILLVQLPIFIGLYYVIRIFTEHRGDIAKFTYDFLESIGPIRELITRPDQFNEKLFGFIDLTKTAFHQGGVEWFLILLAVVAGVTQYVMSKQTTPQDQSKRRLRDIMAEAAEGKEADQAEMNAIVMGKMTKVLPFFMFFVMISLPGAIALYYATSNIVAVLQQAYLIRRDEEEMETMADKALAKEGKLSGKKATHKARERVAKEATVTRIVAKDKGRKS